LQLIRLRHSRLNITQNNRSGTEPANRWSAFLQNHREVIAAMDFFTVPTLTFGVLYGFFVIAHERRRIIYFNVTKHPTSAWIVQQLREAFPYDSTPGYLIFDRGSNFNEEVIDALNSFGKTPLHGISKRGNTYLRRLLIHGARSCAQTCERQRHPLGVWITRLEQRMHRNKVIVALANKIVRVAWKILIKPEEIYRLSEA